MSDTNYRNYQWQETRPGLWTREVDEVELAYHSFQKQWAGCGRSFFHMTGYVSLRIPISAGQDRQELDRQLDDALSKAWMSLRFHHPTIAS